MLTDVYLLRILLLITFLGAIASGTYAQNLTQVIRGQVIDIESRSPLAYATVAVISSDSLMGCITDEQGYFRLVVPVGRYDLQVSYVSYEIHVVPELMVTTGKEKVLTIRMKEQIAQLEEATVRAYIKKDQPLNSMATASARTFSVEEARRYAGGYDDPGRLASSFAGITTESQRDNTIIIRGNSPKGLLWRLEGVEVPNPNHFANMSTFGGGGISALSALVLDNSDFLTGAFPAEYGNAISGVFDIRMRSGNNESYEHAFQLGTMGLDLSSEGPLGKNSRASYLFNYRYSTFGLIKYVLPEDIKDFLPVYQDLSFKFNMPTSRYGVFSIWGLGGYNLTVMEAQQDSALWESEDNRMDGTISQGMGAVGINHKFIFQNSAYLNTSLALTGQSTRFDGKFLGDDLQLYDKEYMDNQNYKISLNSVLNKKFSAKHTNRTGITLDNIHFNTLSKYASAYDQGLITVVDEHAITNLIQFYSQSKLSPSRRFHINAGLHGTYFDLNQELVLEPRLGVKYGFGKAQSIALAYGKHSRIEPLIIYYARVYNGNSYTQPNMVLKLTKAHHLVLSYDISIHPDLRLKIEPYIQLLTDVPVIPDSSYSVLNMEAEWYFDQKLENLGTGRNVGIDLTLERFLKNGFYYLFTASLFNSTYKDDSGVERNTRFNTNYVFNLLAGKEWMLGAQKNKILGINAKFNYLGGKRTSPVDQDLSRQAEDVIYDYSMLYEEKEKDILFLSATINYRINKKKHASIWSLQISNLLMAEENYGLYYNYKTEQVEPFNLTVLIPNLSYKIEF